MRTKARSSDRNEEAAVRSYRPVEEEHPPVAPLQVMKTRSKLSSGKSGQERREEVGQYKDLVERLRRELANKQAEMDDLMEQLVSQKKTRHQLEGLRKEVREAHAQKDAAEQHMAQLVAEKEAITGRMVQRQEEITATQALLEQTQQELQETTDRLAQQRTYEPEIGSLKQALFEKTEECERAQAKNQELEAAFQRQGARKAEIAEVLMEAKATAKTMTETANQEAESIVQGAKERVRKTITEASFELEDISQKASEYHEKLAMIQVETAELMSELVGKSKYLSKRTLH